ncbi:hypothetical protein [Kitasatospora sp. NPDC002040]|uniref:hypothetical protein n=1 Tax=Kitasatospora sp. NPDC002040 TaxID=3154661 RepID=UPI003331C128
MARVECDLIPAFGYVRLLDLRPHHVAQLEAVTFLRHNADEYADQVSDLLEVVLGTGRPSAGPRARPAEPGSVSAPADGNSGPRHPTAYYRFLGLWT